MLKKKFQNHRILENHKKLHIKKRLKCSQCTRVYASQKNLEQHISVVHEGNLYRCDVESCRKTFQTIHSFRDHEKWHTLQFKYTCEVCGKGFMRKDHFVDHSLRHTKEKNYQCDKCKLMFFRKNELKRHLNKSCKFSNVEKVNCPICGKEMKNCDTLRNHRKSVHEEGQLICCPYCDDTKSYHQSTIDRHIRKKHLDKL